MNDLGTVTMTCCFCNEPITEGLINLDAYQTMGPGNQDIGQTWFAHLEHFKQALHPAARVYRTEFE